MTYYSHVGWAVPYKTTVINPIDQTHILDQPPTLQITNFPLPPEYYIMIYIIFEQFNYHFAMSYGWVHKGMETSKNINVPYDLSC